MSEFKFKEVDNEGLVTLDVISKADKFNKWMYQTIKPHCTGRILEIGSGIGNISQFFVNEGADLTLSDIREGYCSMLRKKFSSVRQVIQLNLTDPAFDHAFREYLGQFDTVFALNVVEHIEDHMLAISNCHKLLKPGGRLVILVPAYMSLYNQFDLELEHFRRYTKKVLTDVFLRNQFTIRHTQYFNFMGIFGWYVSGKLQKNYTIPGSQMSLYNKLVPIFKLIDKLTFNQFGLSVIVVGQKG